MVQEQAVVMHPDMVHSFADEARNRSWSGLSSAEARPHHGGDSYLGCSSLGVGMPSAVSQGGVHCTQKVMIQIATLSMASCLRQRFFERDVRCWSHCKSAHKVSNQRLASLDLDVLIPSLACPLEGARRKEPRRLHGRELGFVVWTRGSLGNGEYLGRWFRNVQGSLVQLPERTWERTLKSIEVPQSVSWIRARYNVCLDWIARAALVTWAMIATNGMTRGEQPPSWVTPKVQTLVRQLQLNKARWRY